MKSADNFFDKHRKGQSQFIFDRMFQWNREKDAQCTVFVLLHD
jgi:hypothetical protein